jgi:hypothetical protein
MSTPPVLQNIQTAAHAIDLTIGIIGVTTAGKTTIIRELLIADEEGVDFGFSINVDILHPHYYSPAFKRKFPLATAETLVTLEGTLSVEGLLKKKRVRIIDSKGGALLEAQDENHPLFQATRNCDLLILVLPAETLATENADTTSIDRLLSHARRCTEAKPDAMIAIAYSKCDEYGIPLVENHGGLTGGELRVIEGKKDQNLFERFRHADKSRLDDAWKQFAQNRANSELLKTDRTRLLSRLLGVDSEAGVRFSVSTAVKKLWRKIATNDGQGHPHVNGYFVTALPAETDEECFEGQPRGDWVARGFLQIFADFAQHREQVRGRPTWKAFVLAIGLAILALLALGNTP